MNRPCVMLFSFQQWFWCEDFFLPSIASAPFGWSCQAFLWVQNSFLKRYEVCNLFLFMHVVFAFPCVFKHCWVMPCDLNYCTVTCNKKALSTLRISKPSSSCHVEERDKWGWAMSGVHVRGRSLGQEEEEASMEQGASKWSTSAV